MSERYQVVAVGALKDNLLWGKNVVLWATLFACGCGSLFEATPQADELRAHGRPTVPFTLVREKSHESSPALRRRMQAVILSVNKYLRTQIGRPAQAFAAIRESKNRFCEG